MITRWPDLRLRLTHEPSGLRINLNEGRSLHKMREAAYRMLRGKLWRGLPPPSDLVRSYEIPDGDWSTPDLDTGACIDRDRRLAAKSKS